MHTEAAAAYVRNCLGSGQYLLPNNYIQDLSGYWTLVYQGVSANYLYEAF
jgi:hypothetical protein